MRRLSELSQVDRLHRRIDGVRRQKFQSGQVFCRDGRGLHIRLTIGFARQFRQLIGRDFADLRVEGAKVGEQQSGLRGVVLEQAQLDMLAWSSA